MLVANNHCRQAVGRARALAILNTAVIVVACASSGCAINGQPGVDEGGKPMTKQCDATDEKEIVAHIHGLFQAYIKKDRETIRHGHTADWRGFQTRSTRIVRGIEEYMQAADRILETMEGIRYELHDVEVHIYGDVAVVYYVASYWVRGKDGNEQLVPLRSVDIYRRESGGWNQCGSNISFVPPPVES
jgi:ketosteroid isomerase-like protein